MSSGIRDWGRGAVSIKGWTWNSLVMLRMFIGCLGCGSGVGTYTDDSIVQNLHTHKWVWVKSGHPDKINGRGLPWRSSGWKSLEMLGTQVRSLVQELRSHMPQSNWAVAPQLVKAYARQQRPSTGKKKKNQWRRSMPTSSFWYLALANVNIGGNRA